MTENDTASERSDRVTLEDVVHTGPGTLGGRYLRRFWHPVARAQDLPAGRAKPIRVMSEDFTLYRGQQGAVHVLAFRCAHRGTQLSTGWVEGECLRCFYHGWTYDGTGQCVEAPAEREGFAETVRIAAYPTAEYLGLVFAYLGEGEPPPLPHYPELEDEGVLEAASPTVWPCNFFNRIENSADEVHTAFVHRNSNFTENGLINLPEIWAEETEFGLTKYGKRADDEVRVSHFHMPCSNYIKATPNEKGWGWVDQLSWRVPVDDTSCASYSVNLAHVTGEQAEEYRQRRRQRFARVDRTATATRAGPKVLAGEVRIDDLQERTFIVNVQDYVAQVGQGTIADRAHERLGRSDRVVQLLRKLWLTDLQAFADGQPTRDWRRQRRLEAQSGF